MYEKFTTRYDLTRVDAGVLDMDDSHGTALQVGTKNLAESKLALIYFLN